MMYMKKKKKKNTAAIFFFLLHNIGISSYKTTKWETYIARCPLTCPIHPRYTFACTTYNDVTERARYKKGKNKKLRNIRDPKPKRAQMCTTLKLRLVCQVLVNILLPLVAPFYAYVKKLRTHLGTHIYILYIYNDICTTEYIGICSYIMINRLYMTKYRITDDP